MIVIRLFAAAGNVIIDQRTNTMTLVSLFENIEFQSFPILIPQLFVAALVERAEGDPEKFVLKLRGSFKEVELFNQELEAQFQGKLLHRLIAGIGQLVIPEPGQIKFEISRDGSVLACWAINVGKLGPAEVQVMPGEKKDASKK
jgi:hypothetical protein